MATAKENPFKVVMKKTTLPVTLLSDSRKNSKSHLLQTESFESTFGKRSTRKKPNVSSGSLGDYLASIESATEVFEEKERNTVVQEFKDCAKEYIFSAGQSKRIWNELYKVIDSSDVILQVSFVKVAFFPLSCNTLPCLN